jgi:hypothetical protein
MSQRNIVQFGTEAEKVDSSSELYKFLGETPAD